jgi:mRNA interferase RelE/StbE
MEVKYQVHYQEVVVKKHIPELPLRMKSLIKSAIVERLMVDPVGLGKPLRYSLKGHRRLRVGDYRIVYRIESESKTVVIVAIMHRKDVYDE